MAHPPRVRHVRPAAAGGHRRLRLPGRAQHRQVPGAGARRGVAHVAGRIRGGAGPGARLEPARARCAAGRFRQRRQGDDRAFRQGAGVSDGVRGGAAQGRGDQTAGGGVFSADRAGRALAQPRRARRQGRSVPARDPRGASRAGERGKPPAALRGHDARRAAPGPEFFGEQPKEWAKLVADKLQLAVGPEPRRAADARGPGRQRVEAAPAGDGPHAGAARRTGPSACRTPRTTWNWSRRPKSPGSRTATPP